jgi:hypothetical protein
MNVNKLKVGNKLEVSKDFTVHISKRQASVCNNSNTCTIIYVDSDYVLASYCNEEHILLRYKSIRNAKQ